MIEQLYVILYKKLELYVPVCKIWEYLFQEFVHCFKLWKFSVVYINYMIFLVSEFWYHNKAEGVEKMEKKLLREKRNARNYNEE